MRTTIDSAGRVVVPKALRDAMGLIPGRTVDIVFVDGHLEIETPPARVHVEVDDRLPRLVSDEELAPLTVEEVRDTLEGTRR
ncbi:MAG: AbrB/MazE/SpoVT family DNA-binding domain-containing protein [Lapillicoccus sp.]